MVVVPDPLAPQPPPKPGHGDVWKDVIAAVDNVGHWTGYRIHSLRALANDMFGRRIQGLERYHVPLQYDNGRDPWIDALQEALDLVAYLWQARAPWWMRWGAVGWAWLLSRRVERNPPAL